MLRSLVAGILIAALPAAPALAKHDDQGPPGPHGHGRGEATIVFSPHQRVIVRDYWVEKHGRGKCPPGLAKKHDGCLPPGLAKKRYALGRRCNPRLVVPLPPPLQVRLGPPPPGFVYGVVDGDVVKLAVGTYLVVDAISGLAR
jgi:hypothetical protein